MNTAIELLESVGFFPRHIHGQSYPPSTTPVDVRAAIPTEANFTVTDFSVLLCAAFLVVLSSGGRHLGPKDGSGAMVRMSLLIVVWYWTTTTWAAELKEILAIFTSQSNEPGFPLLGYWLTFTPQVISSALCVAALCYRRGAAATRDMLTPSAMWTSFWILAGGGYWYGQFFTVQSLVFGSPALTFIVKSAEPLSTALLAVLVLRRPFSLPLLAGICVACLGVAVTVLSGDGVQSGKGGNGKFQLVGMLFALLANLGFSSRACVAKKAMAHMQMDPFETYAMMTIVGAQVGMLPLFIHSISNPVAMYESGLIFMDTRFHAWTWFLMSLSYMLYQTCSVLVLSLVAVESHALLVAGKHVLVVVLVSILVHARLTSGVLAGMMITLFGVFLYIRSSKDEAPAQKEEEEHAPIAIAPEDGRVNDKEALNFQRWPRVSSWEAPQPLRLIVLTVVLLGCATPPIIAYTGLRLSSAMAE